MKPVDSMGELARLRETSSPTLTSALQDLSARGPDASELASLATRLSLQGISMAAPSAPPRGPSAPLRGVWKLALGGAAVVGAAAWWFWPTAATPLLPHAAGSGSSAIASTLASTTPVGALAGAPVRQPLVRTAPASTPGAGEPEAASEAPLAQPEADTRKSAPALVAQGTNTVGGSTVPSTPEAAPGPAVRDAAVQRKPGQAPGATLSAAESLPTVAAMPSELEILRGARLALKTAPAEALRLAEQHRATYPSGKLGQERELIAISALVALGRRTAALTRATSFERAFPTSPYRKQIGELLQ